MFTRDELQQIREKAENSAATVKNDYWIRAYEKLAIAVDTLDAMEARTEEK